MEMQLSTIPFLIAGLFGFVGWLALRAEHQRAITRSERLTVWAVLAILVAWALASAYFASSGAYMAPGLLKLMPGLWLPLVPFAIVGIALGVSRDFRHALVGILDVTPPQWLVYVQAVRIAALGGLIKTMQGTFPLYFGLGVGIPDLLFGLSALWVAWAVRRGAIGWRGLAYWNLVGFAVVALPAGPLAQMGLPGPLQVFEGPPASEALFVYPMALAPTVVVPFFVMLNLWAAAWLFLRRPAIG
jgi:hypothetical protein